ncbi:hypothetical protein ACIQYL_07955 [Lysinibacillus xylanilyticus]|uniref:hypothetical protein n=1 Tax=Lysinibacillus xylanilyticus TaxID=582475 RepID=UPI0038067346
MIRFASLQGLGQQDVFCAKAKRQRTDVGHEGVAQLERKSTDSHDFRNVIQLFSFIGTLLRFIDQLLNFIV